MTKEVVRHSRPLGLVCLIFIILVFIFLHNRAEFQRLEDENEYAQSQLNTAQDNLDEANSNIEEAKDAAWGTYDEMGDALDGLEIVQ